MKKNNIEIFFLIAILIITSLILTTLIIQKDGKSSNDKEAIKSERFMFEMYTKQTIIEEVVNSHLYLSLPENNVPFSIQKDIPVFVYRYSAFNCDVCVKFGNSKIEEYFSDKKDNRKLLHIISDFPSNYKIPNANVLDLQKNNLGLPLENANQPFYFVLINNYVCHVFIPDNNFPDYTDTYLQEIKKRYFEN